jgi:large conductance mechanosensitive channel
VIKGSKEFVLRGNIVDLAIAVVIGSAFSRVVDAFVSAIVQPVLRSLPGASVSGWGFALRSGPRFVGADKKNVTYVDFSAIINSIVVFLMTAAVVYFIFVMPMNRLQRLRAKGLAPEPAAVPESTLLLRQIRDALGARPLDGTVTVPQHSGARSD